MKRSVQLKSVLLMAFALMFLSFGCAHRHAKKPPIASPRDSVSRKIGDATITINYGSPSVKGRKIWGALVPYGQVWRTGANAATTFTTDKDILVEGQKLPAGTYGFFAIPSTTTWVIIFNGVPKQWGAFKYDSSQDVLRVTVTPQASSMHERVVYKINSKGFTLAWENLIVPVMVK